MLRFLFLLAFWSSFSLVAGGCNSDGDCAGSCQQAWAVPYCNDIDNECVCLNKFAKGKTSDGTEVWCGSQVECYWYGAWFGWQTQKYGYDCFANRCYPGYAWSTTSGPADETDEMKNWQCDTKCQGFIESSGLLATLGLTNPTIANNVHGFVYQYGTTFMDAHTCKCVILNDHNAPIGGAPFNDLKIAGPNTCQPPFQPDTCRHSGDLIPTNSYVCSQGFGAVGSTCIPQSSGGGQQNCMDAGVSECDCPQAWAVPFCNGVFCFCLNKYTKQMDCDTNAQCDQMAHHWPEQEFGYDCLAGGCYPGYGWANRGNLTSITDKEEEEVSVSVGGCASSPCQNGCTCQASCRDENDYVCVPPAGRPFVGKNCEWEAVVQCTADRSIRISIPSAAVAQYSQGVGNVIVQGCNNAPSYLCNDSPSCGPVSRASGGFYSLECSSNSFVAANGQWTFGQTFVFDRASALISMPRPIVRVSCQMQTRPATSLINPQIRGPQDVSQTLFWQPTFGFYKTKWGDNMILANNGNRLPNGAVGYIIGERIHVRITASLNGVPSVSLPNRHSISLAGCTISPGSGASGASIPIISGGSVVSGTPFPVTVDHQPGLLGGGVGASSEGVGFSFQIFTFGSGSTLKLTCTVSINAARRRRSTGLNETETVSAELLIFEPMNLEPNDIPVLALEQEPEVIIVKEEGVPEEVTISDLPLWFLVALVVLVLVTVVVSFRLYQRRVNRADEFKLINQ